MRETETQASTAEPSFDPILPELQSRDRYWLHILLFLVTLASTVFAGAQWANRILVYELQGIRSFVEDGLNFAVPLLLFLTVHEFGHYFAAKAHKVRTSLPYFIPLPLPMLTIGTLGAVIRIREPVPNMRSLFDIGVAGPIAGFVAAVAILMLTLATLPSPEYILDLEGHHALKRYVVDTGSFPDEMLAEDSTNEPVVLVVGQTILYWALTSLFEDVPPMYEMYHYPALFAAWLGLFFTALNLLPVGQLDGGHILYALVGPKWHGFLARGFVLLLLLSGGIGFLIEQAPGVSDVRQWMGPYVWIGLTAIYYLYLRKMYRGHHGMIAPSLLGLIILTLGVRLVEPVALAIGHSGWLVWSLLIVFIIKVDHPPVLYSEPLTPARRRLGILAMAIFILCFSLKPFSIV